VVVTNAAVKRAVLRSFFNVSVEAGGADSEKQSRTTLGKPFHTRGAHRSIPFQIHDQ